jgi:hypothetical protein
VQAACVSGLCKKPSYSAKAEYPVRCGFSARSWTPRNTGSPAFAGDDDRVCGASAFIRYAVAFSPRDAPELLPESFAPREGAALPQEGSGRYPEKGAGNAGCPLHPQPRARSVVSTRVSHHGRTGITRHSRTRWCYSLFRALLGDRALLSPSPVKSACRARQGRHRSFTNLTPASGRQDHTTSPSASRTLVSRATRVHRIPT